MGTRVTAVIPTYDRPDTLAVAIESVRNQTHEDWDLLVIGDACGPETSEVVSAIGDERIVYHNLPERFGEQAGPNSVGIALAAGDRLAFLNHDDAWLSDHLEAALDSSADFFVGRSAFARTSREDGDDVAVPLFTEVNPPGRRPRHSYTGHPVLFEPASAWVVSTELARRSGYWRAATSMFRTPAQEWVMRAWRRGASFEFGHQVTVLKMVTHYQQEHPDGNYGVESAEHRWLADILASSSPEAMRRLVAAHADPRVDHFSMKAPWPGTRFQRAAHAVLLGGMMGAVYRLTGLDGLDLYSRITGAQRGAILDNASRKRTGAPLPHAPNLDDVIASLR